MEEVLKMSPKERERKAIFEMVKRGCLTLKQAARQNNLSYRQARRVFQAYLKMGDAGLIHKNRDQQSNRKHPLHCSFMEKVDFPLPGRPMIIMRLGIV